MSRVLVIGCGGVASVAIHKICQVSDVFTDICIASRTKSKCDALAKELEDMKRDYELAREEFYKKMRKTKFFGTGRILKSYPDLRIVDHGEIVDKIKETLKYKIKS